MAVYGAGVAKMVTQRICLKKVPWLSIPVQIIGLSPQKGVPWLFVPSFFNKKISVPVAAVAIGTKLTYGTFASVKKKKKRTKVWSM